MLTRRAAIAALSACGLVHVIPADAEPVPERSSEKVARLAMELARALDELNADAYQEDYGSDKVGIWIANVWPSKINPHVVLERIDILAALARRARSI